MNAPQPKPAPEQSLLDLNGRQVHAFASEMANVGYAKMADLLGAMLESGAWRSFQDGLGHYEFLDGEFDYFLTQQGVRREDVINGVRDIEAKARLEAHMDERKTGEGGYRRRITEVRATVPQRPGRPIEPFGVTKAEAKALLNGRAGSARPTRPALGTTVRRWTLTGGKTTRKPSDLLPQVERLRRSAVRLSDEDLEALLEGLKQEQRRRRRPSESLG
ncbi:MAG TPA: hypothetical protein VFA45_16150 [Actinomycetes bacterium]|jgi:hypothetical protein|nr:hypothetical protein [Actinomycetes bacterium]